MIMPGEPIPTVHCSNFCEKNFCDWMSNHKIHEYNVPQKFGAIQYVRLSKLFFSLNTTVQHLKKFLNDSVPFNKRYTYASVLNLERIVKFTDALGSLDIARKSMYLFHQFPYFRKKSPC